MREVAGVAENAGGVSREVLEAADGIGQESEKLRSEVDNFLLAVRDDSRERRGYERIAGGGALATLRMPGGDEVRARLKDISPGGASLDCDLPLATGGEVSVALPSTDDTISARVVRSGVAGLAVVFRQDAVNLARIEQAMDAITAVRRAA